MLENRVETSCEVSGADSRRPDRSREQGGKRPALDVVEGVAAVIEECAILPGDEREHAEIDQEAYDGDHVAAFASTGEGEFDTRVCEPCVGHCGHHVISESSERGLQLGALERRKREAQQHIPAAREWPSLVIPQAACAIGAGGESFV